MGHEELLPLKKGAVRGALETKLSGSQRPEEAVCSFDQLLQTRNRGIKSLSRHSLV